MQFLMRASLVILLVAALLSALAFLLPRTAHVERQTRIRQPPSAIFPLVNDFRRFNQWSPWATYDPDTRYEFGGPADGVGATLHWHSEHPNVGSGSQEITVSEKNRRVEVNLDFGIQGGAKASYTLRPDEDGTLVNWDFDTDLGNNPVARYLGLLFDRWIGPDYERGLARLKSLAETGSAQAQAAGS